MTIAFKINSSLFRGRNICIRIFRMGITNDIENNTINFLGAKSKINSASFGWCTPKHGRGGGFLGPDHNFL